ncbi:MAG TPA: hypothetical protein VK436_02730 [Methanocella sp.]|nr:hypothetical protein [Methanocella sp.]
MTRRAEIDSAMHTKSAMKSAWANALPEKRPENTQRQAQTGRKGDSARHGRLADTV